VRSKFRDWIEEPAHCRAKIPELTAAATAGDINAQLRLAWKYARGDIVDVDIVAAWRWFENAAASGRDDAITHYARFLQLRAVPQGIRLLRQQARKGDWQAQFFLAQHYQLKRGKLSQLRAVVWLHRSTLCGNLTGRFSKFAQLAKIARLPLKVIYIAKAALASISMFRALMLEPGIREQYEPLLFRLNTQTRRAA
jgi:TPR repeat protein